jgi:hypothetical protein
MTMTWPGRLLPDVKMVRDWQKAAGCHGGIIRCRRYMRWRALPGSRGRGPAGGEPVWGAEGRPGCKARPRPPGACANEGRSSVAPAFDNNRTEQLQGPADLALAKGISNDDQMAQPDDRAVSVLVHRPRPLVTFALSYCSWVGTYVLGYLGMRLSIVAAAAHQVRMYLGTYLGPALQVKTCRSAIFAKTGYSLTTLGSLGGPCGKRPHRGPSSREFAPRAL